MNKDHIKQCICDTVTSMISHYRPSPSISERHIQVVSIYYNEIFKEESIYRDIKAVAISATALILLEAFL